MSGPESDGSGAHVTDAPVSPAWDSLLSQLSGASDSHASAFTKVREQLVRFFEWRGSSVADELADETLERVAQKLTKGEPIANVRMYLFGVARFVALEAARRVARVPVDELSSDDPALEADAEDRLRALEQCLGQLATDERALLLAYLDGDGQDRIQQRRELARQHAIAAGALRLRVHRLRMAIEQCVKGKLGGEWSAGPPVRRAAKAVSASAVHDDDLRALLLGELSEAEADHIEAAVFSDDAAMDALACVEDDLLDAWARGELTGDARRRFEARLAASANGRERLATARALATLVRARATQAASPSPEVTPAVVAPAAVTPAVVTPAVVSPAVVPIDVPPGARVLPLRARRAVVAGIAAALAIAAAIAVYLARDPSPSAPQIVVIALGPQIVRGSEPAVPTAHVPRAAGARVRFELSVEQPQRGPLSVVVQGRTGEVARAAAIDDNGRVWAEVDAAALAPGRYRIVLRQTGADGASRDVAAYDVRITEP